ncbi:uncharacterized protein LOC143783250 [Ranitomeya variabilis]|uniref:uncharacterized protein LOC143783250 n=1 Tax=Ranitomeya variabilis TaxID=490064 RepID=UPI0040565EEA
MNADTSLTEELISAPVLLHGASLKGRTESLEIRSEQPPVLEDTKEKQLQYTSFSSEMARRIFDLSNALHVEQVQNILLDDETDPLQQEDLGEESDIASEDNVEECPDVPDTDQDGESEEDAQDIETYYFSGY